MTESLTKNDKKNKNVVLVEYPRKGTWAVGFATNDNEGEISNKTKLDLINILNIPEKKIQIVYQGCNKIFQSKISENKRRTIKN